MDLDLYIFFKQEQACVYTSPEREITGLNPISAYLDIYKLQHVNKLCLLHHISKPQKFGYFFEIAAILQQHTNSVYGLSMQNRPKKIEDLRQSRLLYQSVQLSFSRHY